MKFLRKFVKGSDDNPHCGPLLRGGCCVSSMFFALTDSNEESLWPLCVTSWVTSTCGVDLSTPCGNEEVEKTWVVSLEITIGTPSIGRRLDSANCTNKEADIFSKKLGKSLNDTSADAANAGARPIVLSDSA